MTTKIFRDAALESLAFPDQLDRSLVVVRPRAWLVLGAIGVCLLGLASWAFLGTIEQTVSGEGLWLRPPSEDSKAPVAVVFARDVGSARIQPGSPVRVRPASTRGLSSDWIDARVSFVSPGLASYESMSTRLRDTEYARSLHARLVTPLQIELVLTDPSAIGHRSVNQLRAGDLADGVRIEAEVVVWQGRPIERLLGRSTELSSSSSH